MNQWGTAIVRQIAGQENQAAGGTPTITFGQSVLARNAVVSFVGNLSNPIGVTEPSGFTKIADGGYITPTAGAAVALKNEGFTGTSLPWGSTSATVFASLGIELSSEYPADALPSATISSTFSMGSPAMTAKVPPITGAAGLVKETSVSSGTGNFALLGAASGARTFASKHTNITSPFSYVIKHNNGTEWEEGRGVLVSGQLSRIEVLDGSSGPGVLVNFTSGTKTVLETFTAADYNDLATVAYLGGGRLIRKYRLISGTAGTTSAGCTMLRVRVQGPGANGSSGTPSNGGGGGATTEKVFTGLSGAPTSYTFAIGAVGGNTSFTMSGITVTAPGAFGVAGGVAGANGDDAIAGQPGGLGAIFNTAGTTFSCGNGGSSPFGSGGAGSSGASGLTGGSASGYGAGGGGGTSNPGAGTQGCVEVEEWGYL